MLRCLLIAIALLPACDKAKSGPPEKQAPEQLACAPTSHQTGAIGWYEDDLKAAITCATERKLPVVIDLWAPWCHTCISMQTHVFPDPSLGALADRFVWLAADTDREANAVVAAAYPQQVWPTFVVISPDGDVQGRFPGSASVEQFREFLLEAEKNFLAGEELPAGDPRADVVAAERLVVEAGQYPRGPDRTSRLNQAEERYRKALAAAPAGWPRRPDVLVATLDTISRGRDPDACVAFAMEQMEATGRAASATDFLVTAQGCAENLQDPEKVRSFRDKALARLTALVDDPTAPMTADDRSDALLNVRGLLIDLDRKEEAHAVAERQRQLLDEAAAKAPDPFAAMTYNWPRAEVYVYLGRPLDLVPAIEKSAADLPNEYDPPYRLAYLYKEAGQLDKAVAPARRAADLAYGPRKGRALNQLAEIHRARKDEPAELAARREHVEVLKALPKEQQRPDDLEKAEIALAALEAVQ
jgi:thioredoxin-like negative regulator of GroEL